MFQDLIQITIKYDKQSFVFNNISRKARCTDLFSLFKERMGSKIPSKAKFNSSQSKRKWKGPAGPNSIQVKVRSKSLSLKIILIAKESFKSSSDFRYAAWSYVDYFGDG